MIIKMNFIFLNYNRASGFYRPEDWLHRIRAYTGIPEALAERHEVHSIEQIAYRGEFSQNGVQYHFLNWDKAPAEGSESFIGDMIHAWKVNRYVADLKPDIVLVHGLLFPLQVLLLKWQLSTGAKIIVQNHAEKPGGRYKKIVQRLADRSVDAYLFAAKEMGMEWVRQGIIARDSKVREVMEASSVFAPMDRTDARARTGVEGSPVFLWVGRLDKNKDPVNVVKAFLKFVRQQPGARLYMIFHTAELIAEVKELIAAADNGGDAVMLVGQVPHTEMGYWYNSADLIISGSHYEGSGVAVCEAMSCGCIPVVTNILAFTKMTGDGQYGILYEPGNELALFSALQRSLQIDHQGTKANVLRRFENELSFQAIADKIVQIAGSL